MQSLIPNCYSFRMLAIIIFLFTAALKNSMVVMQNHLLFLVECFIVNDTSQNFSLRGADIVYFLFFYVIFFSLIIFFSFHSGDLQYSTITTFQKSAVFYLLPQLWSMILIHIEKWKIRSIEIEFLCSQLDCGF